ncbi:conserved hypothetical protein [Methylocella tundrae]|uniref:Uncharacterized protein n=1 Tax=Methylocella tundrae TaxID=227605 RepID=A0A8B6M6A3_METTU|nr:conserved hypothetical protein [Methylocella tundrae]VTZ49622.1 conserved hypothetical protein [Methylocella tundrae]
MELGGRYLGFAERLSLAGSGLTTFTHCVLCEDRWISTLTAALQERKGNPYSVKLAAFE